MAVPLFSVTVVTSVTLAAPGVQAALFAPVKVIATVEAKGTVVFISIDPLLIRSWPTENVCAPAIVGAGFARIVAPALLVTVPLAARDLGVAVSSYCRMPEFVRLAQVAAVSTVTVAVFTITALSFPPGTMPPTQVAGALQRPPAAVEVRVAGAVVAWVPVIALLTAPSVTAWTFQV